MALSDMLSRKWKEITQGKEPPLQEVSKAPYKFTEIPSGYTNQTDRFIVILGFDAVATAGAITNPGGTIVAQSGTTLFNITQAAEPTGPKTTVTLLDGALAASYTVFSSKFLLPPRYQWSGGTVMAVICRSLEDALQIL